MRKTVARTAASVKVNQAPSGILVKEAERKVPSIQAIVSHGRSTIQGEILQTMIATRVTMHVSKKVTNITQTPYAFPRRVVLL